MKRLVIIILLSIIAARACLAEVYIYRGPGGERLISDRPMRGYELVSRRNTVRNAGHILANRPVADEGGADPAQFEHLIAEASHRYGLDPALIEAVIQVESGFNPWAISRKGATGLMQLMKSTAERYELEDRFNPGANIDAGARHLSYLMDRFDGRLRLVLAAYNAGATTVERYQGIPPYPETEQYVSKVLALHLRFRQTRITAAGAGE